MGKKNRRSFAQIFLDTLQSLSGDEHRNVGNTALLRRLGWNKTRYERIKSELLGSGKVSTARGKGGAVRLAEAETARTPKIFIAYSHADQELKTELIKHLEPLKKMGLIKAWHDQELKGETNGINLSKAI